MTLTRGDVVAGAFEVEHLLEADSAMEAYRARQLLTGKRVLLKVLRTNADWSEALLERAGGLEEVVSEPIARCLHQGPAGRGRWCFAFEWLLRDDLEPNFPRGASLAIAARIGARIADGLAALHERRIAHGQLRSERVFMVGKDGDSPKVRDFVMAPEKSWLTANARYVAPEVVTGGSITPESDVFALGVILWELVARRDLSTSESRLGVLLETLFDTPDELEIDDAALASWIARMMAIEPLERPEARQVEVALTGLMVGQDPPLLSTPTTREEVDGRVGTALAVLVIRPPPGKDPNKVGLDQDWRRDVEALGLQLVTLPEGTLLGRIRGRTANAVAVSAGLVARATQQCAFRASVVAGLLHEAAAEAGASDRTPLARAALLRAEIADIANIASRTPTSVTRFTSRLASYVGAGIGLKPSADSYLLTPPASHKPKRGGTLEIDTTEKPAQSGKRRKTGEIVVDEPRPARGKGGTLVIEPEPEKSKVSKARDASHRTETPKIVPITAATGDRSGDEPRRGKLDTLVIEAELSSEDRPEPYQEIDAVEDSDSQDDDMLERTTEIPEAPPHLIAAFSEAQANLNAPRKEPTPPPENKGDLTRIAPLPTKAQWGRKEAPQVILGSDTPTLEIEVSEELREMSKIDEKLKARRGAGK